MKRGINPIIMPQVRQMILDNKMPADIVDKLKEDGVSENNLPSRQQISSLKITAKKDTSADSPYRLQTYQQLISYLETKTVKSKLQYDLLGMSSVVCMHVWLAIKVAMLFMHVQYVY